MNNLLAKYIHYWIVIIGWNAIKRTWRIGIGGKEEIVILVMG
jgi:hypothetical protein